MGQSYGFFHACKMSRSSFDQSVMRSMGILYYQKYDVYQYQEHGDLKIFRRNIGAVHFFKKRKRSREVFLLVTSKTLIYWVSWN